MFKLKDDYGGLIGKIMKTLNLHSWVELPDPPPLNVPFFDQGWSQARNAYVLERVLE